MRVIKNLFIEIVALALLLGFYLSTDVYATLYNSTKVYKIQLMVHHSKQAAENINVYFIQAFIVIGVVIILELATWYIEYRKKNKA